MSIEMVRPTSKLRFVLLASLFGILVVSLLDSLQWLAIFQRGLIWYLIPVFIGAVSGAFIGWLLFSAKQGEHAQKMTVLALRQSEARHRALLEAIPDGIMRLRQDGLCLDARSPTNFNIDPPFTDVHNKRIEELAPTQFAQQMMHHVKQTLVTRKGQVFEHESNNNAQRQWYEVRIEPSGANEAIVIVRDITELKETEAARQRAVTNERHRIARELHDSVTQTLFSANMIADVLPNLWEKKPDAARLRLEELRQSARGALAEMRTLLFELRPEALLDADFAQLLRQLAEAATGHSRVPITCQVEGEYQQLPPEVRIAFYRTAQEALNNVAKHAAATTAAVTFRCQPATVALTIQDNGIGFDFQGMAGGHFGLINMRERMSAIGGDLQITSAPGQGVCVTATWQPPR